MRCPMVDRQHSMTTPIFAIAEQSQTDPHVFTVLSPGSPEWLKILAESYRSLRTTTNFPLADLKLDGVQILDTSRLRARLVATQLPERNSNPSRKNFAVERSDFGEVALALAGEELRGYRYGYRSTRDRDLVALPGRGIDQIGVKRVSLQGQEMIVVSLGEAKVSAQVDGIPKVVQGGDDSLWEQHADHVGKSNETAGKLYGAARQSTDEETQNLLFLAAALWEKGVFNRLIVKCTSMLVRPSHGGASDFGKFRTDSSSFAPAEIDFMVLRLDEEDIESFIDGFLSEARSSADEDSA